MATVLIIDVKVEAGAALRAALEARGFQVEVLPGPEKAKAAARRADAIILAAHVGDLASILPATARLRGRWPVPLVLVTTFERTGWDEVAGAREAFDVDALLGLPVDAQAAVNRIEGLLQSRAQAGSRRQGIDMKTILDQAIANEEAAEAFYLRAARAVATRESKDALDQLAKDERGHKQLLLDFRTGRRPLPAAPDAPTHLVDSLGAPDVTADLNPADAFLVAARKEKLAVKFYEDWAKLYPPGPERELLAKLAGMERQHQTRVEGMFANAAFPEAW
jgi:rubrerythrin